MSKEKITANIRKNGSHIIYIKPMEHSPCFAYSTGIEQITGKPEILITGFDKDTSHFLINEYNARIKDGENFEAGKFYEDFIEDFAVTFKQIDKKHYDEYFSETVTYYGGDKFNALHLIWPDISGVFPWEKKAPKEYRALIPRLYKD